MCTLTWDWIDLITEDVTNVQCNKDCPFDCSYSMIYRKQTVALRLTVINAIEINIYVTCFYLRVNDVHSFH